MVKDNEIKATVSPFAIREGELKVFDGKDGYVSMNQIIHRINIGHISDIHFAIIELVNEFEFMTSRQLLQMLEWKGIEVGSQDKLNNKLTKNNKSLEFVFEVIRREDDWEKKLVDKMKLYKDFYENFQAGDSGYMNLPQLIIICEDDKHMAETFKAIVMNKVEISNIRLYFTTDLRQNEETLEKTLVQFVVDSETKKYKMENIEVKLLGI